MARSAKNILPKTFLAIHFAGKRIVFDSKKNLATKRRRKMGSGRFVTSKIDNTGRLSKSIKFRARKDGADIEMEYYGLFVDSGRKPGKYAPPPAIDEWIKSKPVNPRDKKGRFMQKTPANMKRLSFLLNRAIFKYGIEPTYFFTKPLEREIDKLQKKLPDLTTEDLNTYFSNDL